MRSKFAKKGALYFLPVIHRLPSFAENLELLRLPEYREQAGWPEIYEHDQVG